MMEAATRQIEERKKQLSFVAPVPIVQVKKNNTKNLFYDWPVGFVYLEKH